MLEACENFTPMLPEDQAVLVAKGAEMEVIF
jgi:hypothetical protein